MPFADRDSAKHVTSGLIFEESERDDNGNYIVPKYMFPRKINECKKQGTSEVFHSLNEFMDYEERKTGEKRSSGVDFTLTVSAEFGGETGGGGKPKEDTTEEKDEKNVHKRFAGKVAVSMPLTIYSKKQKSSKTKTQAKRIENSVKNGGKVMVSQIDCRKNGYSIKLKKSYIPKFAKPFLEQLSQLSHGLGTKESAEKEYKDFIGLFGTHFSAETVTGAFVRSVFTLTEKESKKVTDEQLKNCAKNMTSETVLNSNEKEEHSTCSVDKSTAKGKDYSASGSLKVTYRGVLPEHSSFESDFDPIPINRELVHIGELFQPEPFKAMQEQVKELGLTIAATGKELKAFFYLMFGRICELYKVR